LQLQELQGSVVVEVAVATSIQVLKVLVQRVVLVS
jgi:hypothetical protein